MLLALRGQAKQLENAFIHWNRRVWALYTVLHFKVGIDGPFSMSCMRLAVGMLVGPVYKVWPKMFQLARIQVVLKTTDDEVR